MTGLVLIHGSIAPYFHDDVLSALSEEKSDLWPFNGISYYGLMNS
ncbi:hypothetical protein CPC197_1236, partial [Chlamydia psittaci C1/97]